MVIIKVVKFRCKGFGGKCVKFKVMPMLRMQLLTI